ncbi:hypothetical protein CPB83DRAFT_900769 [Crepidotus variabilis]|uniref:Uncharacterized protein n=1 Tax=Crepidotus variabilis TaxID=179855 RepID=A0A9P6BE10_9AGAR|nr:hypothetical protein CPB83DRAFT_900769 [Crepidotus variabilis]
MSQASRGGGNALSDDGLVATAGGGRRRSNRPTTVFTAPSGDNSCSGTPAASSAPLATSARVVYSGSQPGRVTTINPVCSDRPRDIGSPSTPQASASSVQQWRQGVNEEDTIRAGAARRAHSAQPSTPAPGGPGVCRGSGAVQPRQAIPLQLTGRADAGNSDAGVVAHALEEIAGWISLIAPSAADLPEQSSVADSALHLLNSLAYSPWALVQAPSSETISDRLATTAGGAWTAPPLTPSRQVTPSSDIEFDDEGPVEFPSLNPSVVQAMGELRVPGTDNRDDEVHMVNTTQTEGLAAHGALPTAAAARSGTSTAAVASGSAAVRSPAAPAPAVCPGLCDTLRQGGSADHCSRIPAAAKGKSRAPPPLNMATKPAVP